MVVIHDLVDHDVFIERKSVWVARSRGGWDEPGVVEAGAGGGLADLGVAQGGAVGPVEEDGLAGCDGEGELRGVDQEKSACED